jgi:hypothetical protein
MSPVTDPHGRRSRGRTWPYVRALILPGMISVLLAGNLFGQDGGGTRNPHGPIEIACEVCHTATSWTPVRTVTDFDHNSQTTWPLVGPHRDVECVSCHAQPLFADVGSTCADCHADIHRRQFGAGCEDCHSELAWQIPVESIEAHLNRFPLQGAHAAESCESCHTGAATAAFTGLSTLCISCHSTDYETAPLDHLALNFPTDCESCHSMGRWQTAVFVGHAANTFPLTGAHASVGCESCHVGGQFTGLDTACVSCHLADFTQTTAPNHLAAGFPDDCTLCHSTAAWVGAGFAHDQTQFPLTGAHVTLGCEACHVGGQFIGLDTTCFSCHDDDFNQTTTPNHLAAGLSTTCELCHNTSGWPGAVFDHSTTRFPLLGAHTTATCASCHVGDVFAGTPTDCYSCHSTEYQSVTDPSHLAAGFPTTCEDCHGNTTWTGATLNHTFPIYSGAHNQEKWNSCSTCHTNPANFTTFSCLNCHEHSQVVMDDKHSAVGGYVYESLSCYSCHPAGRR